MRYLSYFSFCLRYDRTTLVIPGYRVGPPPATLDMVVHSSSKSLESIDSKSSFTAPSYSAPFIPTNKSRAAPADDDATAPASYYDAPSPVAKVRTSPPTPERNTRYVPCRRVGISPGRYIRSSSYFEELQMRQIFLRSIFSCSKRYTQCAALVLRVRSTCLSPVWEAEERSRVELR